MENSKIQESIRKFIENGWDEIQVTGLLDCLADYRPRKISNDLTNLFHYFAIANADGEQSFQSSFTGPQYRSLLFFLHQVNNSLNS
jgi:hypothetical protein